MTTQTLNLSEGFKPKDGFEVKFINSVFPGGEPNFRILGLDADQYSLKCPLVITQRYNSMADIVLVVVAHDAARRAGFTNIELVMPYFPAARQDRVCNSGESLTVKVFADMINACNFKKVSIYAPHSDVTPALINNVELIDRDSYFLNEIIDLTQIDSGYYDEFNIVCPDAGAGKRVADLTKRAAQRFPDTKINFIRCEKVRDVVTGALTEFVVHAEDLNGAPTIICDDIVAYGGTFKGLGAVLREKNCGKLMLFTSHADCIEGVEAMGEFFDYFYTTNSKKNWDELVTVDSTHDKIECFKLQDL